MPPMDSALPDTIENLIGDYVCHSRRTMRLVETALDNLAEQDRHLYRLIDRYGRGRVSPPATWNSTAAPRLQTTLDGYLRPTPAFFGGARVVGQRAPQTTVGTGQTGQSGPHSLDQRWTFTGAMPMPMGGVAPPDFFSAVTVRPNEEQIVRATRRRTYGEISNPLNTVCPITQTEFASEDSVTEITHCNHLFSQRALQQWFQHNVHCPLCRHDIRETLPLPQNTSQDIATNMTNAINATNTSTANMPSFAGGNYGMAPLQLNPFPRLSSLLQGAAAPYDLSLPLVDASGGVAFSYSVDAPLLIE